MLPPSAVIKLAIEELGNPLYDAGPNDKGIGIQLGYSLYRVLTGFLLAAMAGAAYRFSGGDVAADAARVQSLHAGAKAHLAACLDAAGAVFH